LEKRIANLPLRDMRLTVLSLLLTKRLALM
jgi:hypothetical protein